MGVKTVRRLAAQILKAGEKRIWLDPTRLEEIGKAITKDDVRILIRKGYVKSEKKKGIPRVRGKILARKRRKGRRRGYGKRRGRIGARAPKKKAWIARIRAQRKLLRKLKEQKLLIKGYRIIYNKIKGGEFSDRRRMLTYLKERGYLKGEKK